MDLINKVLESKTFCIYPWMHQYVGPQGEVKPCCLYDPNGKGIGNLKDNTLDEIWNNEETKALRLKMLNGETDSRCFKCNIHQDGISPKEGFNKAFFTNTVYRDTMFIKENISNLKQDL